MRKLINDGWSFALFETGTKKEDILNYISGSKNLTPEKDFAPVDIPHDWLIYDVNNLYKSGMGVYTRSIDLDSSKNNSVYFDGVYMNTTVYLNGIEVAFSPYGYSSFEADLGPAAKPGDNLLTVICDYISPNSRWYSGAGIFRDVFLYEREETHLETDGVYISSTAVDPSDIASCRDFILTVDTGVFGANASAGAVSIVHTLLDACGNVVTVLRDFRVLTAEDVASALKDTKEADIYKEDTAAHFNDDKNLVRFTACAKVSGVTLWELDAPYLYTLKTQLFDGENLLDETENKVGFRTAQFDPDKGFFLNGKHLKINGACMHHDLGCLGAAFNRAALKRQFEKLKEIGVNAVRTAHNMPASALMDIADETGMLIDSEAFDMWEMKKNTYDYGLYFKEWCEIDVKRWVMRDRNHPSLIMWSVGNEIPDTNNEGSEAIAYRLCKAVKRYDYRRNGHTTIGSNFVAWPPAQKSSEAVEVAGYNYLESVYDEHHEKFPHWCIYGSETSSTVQSRGVYHFPKEAKLLTYDDQQCSSLDNCTTNWGARSVHDVIAIDRDKTYSMGQFIWTGWDYIGEPTPYFTKNSYFGHIDTAGFFKDTAYIFKAAWTDYKKSPFVHIAPYWCFNEGQVIDIIVTSNAPKVQLFLNGTSLGSRDLNQKEGTGFSAAYKLPYEAGTLTAIAYDENGAEIAKDEKKSFTDPASICLTAENSTLMADGEDLLFLQISILDKDGNEVANARNRINITVSGEGRLLGLDNGDSTDYEEYKGGSRKLFSGKLLAVIGSTKTAGDVTVKVSSPGTPDAIFEIQTTKVEPRKGAASGLLSVTHESIGTDIPVRQILLKSNSSLAFNPEHKEAIVTATLLPENTTCTEVFWKSLTAEGIPSSAIKIDAEGLTAKVSAIEDGECRIVCYSLNGTEIPTVLSDYEISVTGLGKSALDPYEKIYGCKLSECNNDCPVSFEGSVNLPKADNIVRFDNVDFGEYGSDEITVSLFTFASEEPLEIYEGNVEDGICLFTGKYEIPSIYNVLQENTFKLNKRIKGVKSISFKFPRSLTFGGFYMTKYEKAYGELNATEYNMITGDSYDIREDGVYAIGNNTDIQFTHMNFTKGVKSITIKGRSRIPENPVHVRFMRDGDVIKNICLFTGSDEIKEMTFPVENVTGEWNVNFIFLPGSDFDLIGFKFEE